MGNIKPIISKENLYKLTQQCRTIKEMASIIGVSRRTCKNLLVRNGVEFETNSYKRNISHPEINKQWFIENWINTDKSLHTLAEENNLSEPMLEYRSSSFGLTKGRKYSIDKEKILNSHNPNTAYMAGLIVTDGYVNTNADFVSISLVGDSEINLLNNIRNAFGITAPIQDYHIKNNAKHTVRHSLRISCEGIKDFLQNEFNIVGDNKTFKAAVPSRFFNEDCAKAYFLGCADGDGCITHFKRSSPTFNILSASVNFVEGLGKILDKYTNIVYSIRSERAYFVLSISGLYNVAEFLEWIYSSSCTLYLERKYDKFLMVKDIVCSARNSKELQK